jgi:O-antigen ligase
LTQMFASTDRRATSRTHRAAPVRNSGPAIRGFGPDSRALVVVTIATVGLALLPGLMTYLNVEHLDVTLAVTAPRVPIAHVASMAASAVLVLVCSVVLFMRGHPDRNVSGAILLLLGLVLPYIVTPGLPGRGDITSVALAAAVILAVWNVGASVDELKWVSISGSLVAAYSIVGGLIAPEHMMYGLNSKKALIGNIQLAGPFGHSNTLGIYCLLALALVPFIVSVRWRIFHGLILCTAIVESASRTALVAAGILALWWILCRFRSVISVRAAGLALVGSCAVTVLVLPLLSWDSAAFTGRANVWAESLSAWQESRLFGVGINWFATAVQTSASVATWGYLRSGHNLLINTLVTSGLVGVCLVVLLLLAAIRSTLALEVTSHQIACFGYLIAFLVLSTTEAIWILLPNTELFPVVGLVFAVLLVARHGAPETATE